MDTTQMVESILGMTVKAAPPARAGLGAGRVIDHFVTSRIVPGSFAADCSCGWGVESSGRDESSRASVKTAIRNHEDGVTA